jgi:hypothetical protein
VPLSDEQRREGVGLLAELLVDAALKRKAICSDSGFDGVLGGASGGVASLPDGSVRGAQGGLMGHVREPRQEGASSSSGAGARPLRVSAERLFELARHLTERDREVALYLYRHRVLTTGQLQLLFFSSRRRAQDRLLFLYRDRVLDRFYPPAPFGLGKPEAHWLLDEAGAVLVAALHDLERKQLGWQRRGDWGSHPQLAHQLEVNRFVTDLIAATLSDPGLGVSEWWPPVEAADHLSAPRRGRMLPDAGSYLETPAGPIECYLEWDRATETRERLAEKLLAYRLAEAHLYSEGSEPRCILRRAQTRSRSRSRISRPVSPCTPLPPGTRCLSRLLEAAPSADTDTWASGGGRAERSDSQPLSFSASSVWRVSTRFRLQIRVIPRCEQSFGTPHAAIGLSVCHSLSALALLGFAAYLGGFLGRAERSDDRLATLAIGGGLLALPRCLSVSGNPIPFAVGPVGHWRVGLCLKRSKASVSAGQGRRRLLEADRAACAARSWESLGPRASGGSW